MDECSNNDGEVVRSRSNAFSDRSSQMTSQQTTRKLEDIDMIEIEGVSGRAVKKTKLCVPEKVIRPAIRPGLRPSTKTSTRTTQLITNIEELNIITQ